MSHQDFLDSLRKYAQAGDSKRKIANWILKTKANHDAFSDVSAPSFEEDPRLFGFRIIPIPSDRGDFPFGKLGVIGVKGKKFVIYDQHFNKISEDSWTLQISDQEEWTIPKKWREG